MKSVEVYRILKGALDPSCKSRGFKKTKSGMLGWYGPMANKVVVFWCQCSQDGWDAYAGSKFVVEFQVSDELLPGHGESRSRLGSLCTDEERAQITRIQNDVIARLPRPPHNHPFLGSPAADWYLAKFKPVTGTYNSNADIWLRYHREDDVARWGEFIRDHLSPVLDRFESTVRASG